MKIIPTNNLSDFGKIPSYEKLIYVLKEAWFDHIDSDNEDHPHQYIVKDKPHHHLFSKEIKTSDWEEVYLSFDLQKSWIRWDSIFGWKIYCVSKDQNPKYENISFENHDRSITDLTNLLSLAEASILEWKNLSSHHWEILEKIRTNYKKNIENYKENIIENFEKTQN